jgi:phosphatidylglycerol:prolipoprotein diacylglycerol transferase
MYSELIRIPISWHGIPIFGIGVVLLVWLAIGAWTMAVMAKQVGWGEALKAHLPTLAIVGLVIAIGVPRLAPDGVPVRSYGVLMLAGIVAGIGLAMRRAVQAGLDAEDVLGLALWVIPGGAIGGRLFYVIQYWSTRIRQPDLWSTIKNVLAFTEGGLVVYGAFIGAMAAFAIYMLRHKLPALAMADIMAPGMMVGLSLGRLGCLMNGCCYGGESHLPWAITFPRENHADSLSPPYAEQASYGRFYGFRIGTADNAGGAVAIEQVDAGSPAAFAGLKAGETIESINGGEIDSEDAAHRAIVAAFETGASLEMATSEATVTIAAITAPPRSLPVHPAQIYSSIDAALLAWVLWSFYPYRRHDGEVMALMLMLHPISRFLLETIRVDEAPVWGTGLSISQNLSVGLFLVGLGLWVAVGRKPRGNLAFPLAGPLAA